MTDIDETEHYKTVRKKVYELYMEILNSLDTHDFFRNEVLKRQKKEPSMEAIVLLELLSRLSSELDVRVIALEDTLTAVRKSLVPPNKKGKA